MNKITNKITARCLFFAWALMMGAPSSHAQLPWQQGDGFYVGVGGGYGYGDFHADLATVDGELSGDGFTADPDNAFGSLYAGYGEIFDERYYVAAEFALGLWAGGDRSNAVNIRPYVDEVLSSTGRANAPSEINGRFFAEPKQDFSIYSRVGYLLPEDRGLLYMVLGWTYGVQTLSFSTDSFDLTSGTTTIPASFSSDNVGLSSFTYGAGLELPVADTLAMRIQYRYIDFGSNASVVLDDLNDQWTTILGSGESVGLSSSSGSGTHVLSLGLGYFF